MSQRPLILLIDDNQHGLLARRAVLEEQGYEVETARSGADGLKKFEEQSFDLVVTDYRMPKMDGLAVLHEIRQKDKRARVVILSGYANRLGLTQKSTGADAVLPKGPNECQDLIRVLAGLLRKGPGRQRAVRGGQRKSGIS